MADPRFFPRSGPFTLQALAELTGATLSDYADGQKSIQDVAPLDRAGPDEISFLDNSKYIETFTTSKAGACIVRTKFAARAPKGMALLMCDEPYRAYAFIAQKFYPATPPKTGVSPLASVDPTAVLGTDCSIDPFAVIHAGATLGSGCVIQSHVVIGPNVVIGDHSFIGAGATLSHCMVGSQVIIHPGVHIGQDGFGFAMGREGHAKVPQLGRVIIEDDVEIGAGTCIDRGTGPDTQIGQGSKIDNLVQIGHNVQIGRHCVIVAQNGIAGSSRIGDYVTIAGQSGVAGHHKIGNGARIAARAGVVGDVPAGASYGGFPAVPISEWHRQIVTISRSAKRKKEQSE